MAGRAGVIDLRDLSGRYAWDELCIARLMAAGGLVSLPEIQQRFGPPEVVVAVAPFEDLELVERSRAWLSDAASVVLLRWHDATHPLEDPELVEYIEELWNKLSSSFEGRCEIFDWREAADVAPALRRACQLARSVGPAAPARATPPPRELSSGPRFEILHGTRRVGIEVARGLACGLRVLQDGAVLDTESRLVRLADQISPVELGQLGRTLAVLPDGRRMQRGAGRQHWRIGEREFTASGFLPLGFDAQQAVGWTGFRMFPFWLYVGQSSVGFLSASDHDFPCGPSKKLYGYADNEPLRVELASDLSTVAYFFEHDVLLTSALPIRWRSAGELDVADFPRDPGRAVFFVHDATSPFTDNLLDEDARDRPPVVVLGPSAEARYAVDLTSATYRILGAAPRQAQAAFLGGPEVGFAVYDGEHRVSRKAEGHLLGGSQGRALLQLDNRYVREDLRTGERVELREAFGSPVCAVPVPGTTNVLLVTAEGERHFAQLL